ncbi:MAG: hypothetical protein F6J93_36805 [Oscillatoria sp. SIO1A7]|nr:hypothetical protein [Oscillatoria sp. SIO1A7]
MPITQISPHRVKPSEATMINSVWIDLKETPQEFVNNKQITYLWVLYDYSSRSQEHSQSEEKTVIVGIEEPWKYMDAFDKSVHPKLEEMKKHYEETKDFSNSLGLKDGMGGHPTLAAWFSSDGRATGSNGCAYIGGELYWDKKTWFLNNQSGRFGRAKGDHKLKKEQIEELLNEAKEIIEKAVNIEITVEVIMK